MMNKKYQKSYFLFIMILVYINKLFIICLKLIQTECIFFQNGAKNHILCYVLKPISKCYLVKYSIQFKFVYI